MAARPSPIICHTMGLDLHSNKAVSPDIRFKKSNNPDTKIVLFNCTHPVATCVRLKQWLLWSWKPVRAYDPNVLRIENQRLDTMKKGDKATLVLLEDSATLEGQPHFPVAIFALFMPHDERIRWFYSLTSPKFILIDLHVKRAISITRQLLPNTNRRHAAVYIFLTEHFTCAIRIPDSPDWATASQITDYAPSIASPESALARITGLERLYTNHAAHRDLSSERYLMHFHPAEIELASAVQLTCSEYLSIKRFFFQAFGVLCLRNRETLQAQIDGETKSVRTEYAHQQWLEREYGWRATRAKKLVAGWRILGFLDERRFLAWAREGAMLEGVGLKDGEGNGESEVYEETVVGGVGADVKGVARRVTPGLSSGRRTRTRSVEEYDEYVPE